MREPSGWLISATPSIDLTIYAYIYPKELALFMKIKKKNKVYTRDGSDSWVIVGSGARGRVGQRLERVLLVPVSRIWG